MSARMRTALAASALVVAVGIVSVRVLGPLRAAGGPSVGVYAMSDFRDAVYNPVAAFLDAENPYDRASFTRKYPGSGGIGLYSPLSLLLHLPSGLLSLSTAALVYYVVSLVGTIALAPLALHLGGVPLTAARALGLAALLIASRPGHWNLFTGQVTLQAALGTYAALWYARRRPAAAGVGLALATFKPTYGLPLAALMLARGDWRALGIGLALATILTGIVGAVLVWTSGLGPLVASVVSTYEAREATPWKSAAVDPFRVDVVALVARGVGKTSGVIATLALSAGVLGFAAIGLRRLGTLPDRDARPLGLALGVLAIVTCTYHMQYDVVALAPLLAALLWPPPDGRWGRAPHLRWVALGLLAIPFVNYLASETAAREMDMRPGVLLVVSSFNGGALLALLALFGTVATRARQPACRAGLLF
jgi:hypothetical protein